MRVTRIAPGADGSCQFDEIEVAQPHLVEGQGMRRSDSVASPAVELVTLPAGFDLGFHPSGRRLLLVVLSGTVEVTVPSGDSRRFEPGTAFVSEDIASGHATRTVDGPAEMLFVTLPEGNGWPIGP